MQKRFGAIILTFMSLLLTCFLTGLPAQAAEKAEQYGLEVSVSSGKEEYAAAEDADISFTIRNTIDSDADGVNWELQLPEGLSAKSGSLSGENLRIRAGESYEGSVFVELAAPDTTEAVTDTAETTTADGTTTAPAVQAGETASALGFFGIIAAAAALAWIARKKSRKLFGILSVFFCAGMIAVSAPVRIFAADEDGISVLAEKTVKIDGTSYTIKLSVTADAMQEAANPGDFYAWAEYSKDNNAITVKWQAQENASGYKVYDKSEPETPLAKFKDKTEYVYPLDETAKAKYVFFVKAESADGKQTASNDVTLRRNSDGSYTFSDIDSDRDGLDDLDEISRKTDRLNPDTDGDGLKDGYEVNQASTDPLTADTDENGTPDGAEDFDSDGIPTQQESQYRANPYAGDTDEDGFPDSYEIANGMDPAIHDEILMDNEKAANVKEYTLTDIEAFNENEEYPLEIYYNNDKFIERINGVYATEKIQNAQDALYSLYHIKSLLGMEDPAAELKITKSVFSQWSVSYSFVQVYQGIEAEGRTVTITCKKGGKISSIFSGYLCDKHFKKLNLKPTVTKQRLKQIVNNGSDKSVEIFSSDLCIRMNPDAVLVYRVVTSAQKTVWIDAHTGKIVYEKSNLIMSYSGHYRVDALDENSNSRFIDVQLVNEGKTDTYYMRYDDLKTGAYLYNDIYVQNSFHYNLPDVESESGFSAYSRTIDLSDPDHPFTPSREGWDSQAVSAYSHFFEVRKRYASKGYYGLNGENGPASIFVHADPEFGILSNTANAGYFHITTYDGAQYEAILFTDPCERSTTYADDHYVFGHEYGHAVVEHKKASSSTLSTIFMGAVNEAYADVFGCWVDQKWAARQEPLRDITNPHNSKNPKKIDDEFYNANSTDPHLNSTIISYAAYLLNTKYGYSLDDLFDVFKESVRDLSDSITTFDGIRNSLASAARTMFPYDKALHIYEAFEEVGVTWPKSSAKITVKEGSKFIKHATVAISNDNPNKTGSTDENGTIVFKDLLVGSHEVMVSVLAGPTIRTTVLVLEDKQAECVIDLLAASTDYDWDCYDHYNFDQYYGPTLPKHIEINGKDIKMRGYTEVNFKDFLLTHENDDPNSFVHGAGKILSFSIDRDEADWHTLEGGGFLFDVSITKPSESAGDAEVSEEENGETENSESQSGSEIVPGSEGFLTAHCILVTRDGLKIYYLENVDIALFRNGKLYAINMIGQQIGEYAYDIGDVKAHHSISINIRKGAVETISILDSSKVVVENLEVNKLDGDDYGPITSHDGHWCEQESWFTFSDIAMSNVK